MGTQKNIDAYRANIAPCKDCKYCFHKDGCSIKDDMTEIYSYVKECDNVIIASPMHFEIVSAPLVTLFSRLQTYWSITSMPLIWVQFMLNLQMTTPCKRMKRW